MGSIFTIFFSKSFPAASAIAFGSSGARVRASIGTSKQFLPETPHPNHPVGHDHLHIYGIRMPRIRCKLQRYVWCQRPARRFTFRFFLSPFSHFLHSRDCIVAHANRFPDGELPRWNFTDIFHSFMTVFRALCGEWFETFTDCFLVNGHASLVYYVALVIVGGFAVSVETNIPQTYGTCNARDDQIDESTNKLLEQIE